MRTLEIDELTTVGAGSDDAPLEHAAAGAMAFAGAAAAVGAVPVAVGALAFAATIYAYELL